MSHHSYPDSNCKCDYCRRSSEGRIALHVSMKQMGQIWKRSQGRGASATRCGTELRKRHPFEGLPFTPICHREVAVGVMIAEVFLFNNPKCETRIKKAGPTGLEIAYNQPKDRFSNLKRHGHRVVLGTSSYSLSIATTHKFYPASFFQPLWQRLATIARVRLVYEMCRGNGPLTST